MSATARLRPFLIVVRPITADASDRSSYRIDDRESDEVLFVIRYHNTLVRPGDCGDDHVEPASRLAGRFAFSHQARPDQPRLVVERQYTARKERLGSLRPGEPLVECVALLAARLLQNPAADFCNGQRGDK